MIYLRNYNSFIVTNAGTANTDLIHCKLMIYPSSLLLKSTIQMRILTSTPWINHMALNIMHPLALNSLFSGFFTRSNSPHRQMFFQKFKELCIFFLTSLLEYHWVIRATFILLFSVYFSPLGVIPFLSFQQIMEELSNVKTLLLES